MDAARRPESAQRPGSGGPHTPRPRRHRCRPRWCWQARSRGALLEDMVNYVFAVLKEFVPPR